MYDTTEFRVVEQVYLKPGIHKRELAKQLGLGMPSIDYAMSKLGRLIKASRAGNQIRYSLDYSREALSPALCAVEFSRLERLPPKAKAAARALLDGLEDKPLIAALFGSYAKGNYTRESDIDILLVFQKLGDGKPIEAAARKAGMRTGTKISPVYLDYPSFRSSFHNATKEFYRNIRKDRIVIIGVEYWRQLQNEEA